MAIKKDIQVDQGSNFTEHVLIQDGLEQPIDLVGNSFTARLQVKRSYNDNAPIVLELTTENGGIVLHSGGIIGRVSLVIDDTETDALTIPCKVFDCIYDWELIDGTGYVRRIYEGAFRITKNLTV